MQWWLSVGITEKSELQRVGSKTIATTYTTTAREPSIYPIFINTNDIECYRIHFKSGRNKSSQTIG